MQSYLNRIEVQKETKAYTQKFFDSYQKLVDMDKTLQFKVIEEKNDIKDYFAKCFVEELNNYVDKIVTNNEKEKLTNIIKNEK